MRLALALARAAASGLAATGAVGTWAALRHPVGPTWLVLARGHGVHAGDAAALVLLGSWLWLGLVAARPQA